MLSTHVSQVIVPSGKADGEVLAFSDGAKVQVYRLELPMATVHMPVKISFAMETCRCAAGVGAFERAIVALYMLTGHRL